MNENLGKGEKSGKIVHENPIIFRLKPHFLLSYFHLDKQMTLSKKPYRGSRDFFPELKRIQDYLFNKMGHTAQSFGYLHYDGPMLEEVDLYLAKSGEELINDQIYSFKDRGERFVAIRPEMTPTLARMVAQVHREQPKPMRWYSIPNLLRYEKPQRGRLREHWQFNCDIFGSPKREGEIEILEVIHALFSSFGADHRHYEILFNDRAIIDSVFRNILKADDQTAYKLYKIVDKSKKVPPEALDKMLGETVLDEKQKDLLKNYLKLKNFSDLEFYLKKHNQQDTLNSFLEFYQGIDDELKPYLSFDPCIVRGLDYYTGIVFEVFDKHPDNRRALCGGGAYDNLLQIFKEPALKGVGFGLGDVTLKDFLETHGLLPDLSKPKLDVYVTYQSETGRELAKQVAKNLRVKHSVMLEFEAIKMKKVFSSAEKRGASFVVLIGDEEEKNQAFTLKDLNKRSQETFTLKHINDAFNFMKES